MRRLALLFLCAAVLCLPARADALTIQDLIDLTRAGLGDDILLALIEVDRSVLPVDTATLKRLKEAGVSERVILAVVRSGRSQPPPPPAPAIVHEPEPAPPPPVVVIEHREQVREVPVAVPVYIAVPTYPGVHPKQRRANTPAVDPLIAPQPVLLPRQGVLQPSQQVQPPPEPVYWGWGGKRRPDTWKEK